MTSRKYDVFDAESGKLLYSIVASEKRKVCENPLFLAKKDRSAKPFRFNHQ